MPILKFETKLIDGRPNIVFETERQKQASKRRDYKSKIQKYPLRNVGNDQDNIEPVTNYTNDTKSKTAKDRSYSFSSTPRRTYENELFDSSNKRTEKKQSTNKKESLFNLLKKEPKESVNESNNFEKISKSHIQGARPRKKSLTDEDIDDIMRQVVLENKEILSDNQLVDLLAKIYIEAKKGSHKDDGMTLKEANAPRDRDMRDKHHFVPPLDMEPPQKSVSHSAVPNSMITHTIPLTMAQKKQMQWDKERLELAKITSYNPWGRPGCGAPIKDQYEDHSSDTIETRTCDVPTHVDNHRHVPSARTSELTGLSQAEIKRRQWVIELNEQVAEKERLKFQSNHQSFNLSDPHDNKSSMNTAGDLSPGHGRGKGLADLNQITSEELSLKRRKQMEQQEAIKKQIEEKEFLKRIEREKKALLDQQEEMRISKEKQQLDSHYMSETARVKQREDESGRRFAQLRTQVEEAEKAALLEKRMKRMQRLELAGHDTRGLKAGIVADQMTGRLAASTEFLSEENSFNKFRQEKVTQRPDYDITPRNRYTVTEDHGFQTDGDENDDFDTHKKHRVHRNRSVETVKDVKKLQRSNANNNDNKSVLKKQEKNPIKIQSATYTKQDEKLKSKRPESIGSRKPWGVKKINKKYIPQSKRDPFYTVTKDERENHKHERVNRILAQVRANMDRIPDTDVADGHLSQRHKRCDDRRGNDHDKENIAVNHGTYDIKDGDYFHSEEDDDRVQASVRYKDSYRQPGNQRTQHVSQKHSKRNAWTPNTQRDLWDESDHEIVRTTDVLDPSSADKRCLISREDTGRERARNSYYKSQNPGQLGDQLDKQYSSYKPHNGDSEKHDPLSYPQGHPTNRQNTILKQLSDIRADLRMRQKEIETSLSINEDL